MNMDVSMGISIKDAEFVLLSNPPSSRKNHTLPSFPPPLLLLLLVTHN